MFIKDIKYQYEDNGVTSIKFQTTKGTIQGLFRAYNPPEILAWKDFNNEIRAAPL
jgi:hypothetical protein